MRSGACRRSANGSRSTSWRASTAPSACCSAVACRSWQRSTWAPSCCIRCCASGWGRGGAPPDRGAELLHPLLRERLAAASRAISEGRNVSQSLEANGLTTPVALRMIAVGEKGGNMGEMLEQVAAFHDEELARWVDWFTRLFEPILMAVIGLVIGVIVVLMYMPIFELAGNLQ